MGCGESGDKAKLEELDKEVKAKQTQIDKLETELKHTMREPKKEKKDSDSDSDSGHESKKARIARLQSEVSAGKLDLKQADDRLQAALAAQSAIQQERDAANADLEALKLARQQCETVIAGLQTEKDAHILEIARLNDEIAVLKQQVADTVQLTAALATQQSALAEAQAQCEAVEQRLQAALSEKAEVEGRVAAAQQALANQAAVVESLASGLEGQAAAVAQLNGQLEALKTELGEAAQGKAVLEADLSRVISEKGALDEQVKEQMAALLRADQVAEELGKVLGEKEALEALVKNLELAVAEERQRAEQLAGAEVKVHTKSKHRDCINLSRKSHLGVTGKYYCGKRMPDEEDICGPLRGSNCFKCQKLDIEARDLPKGFLVNMEGRIARKAEHTEYWYCGAQVLQGGGGDKDGFCGPTEGPNCRACQDVQNLVRGRYRRLLDDED